MVPHSPTLANMASRDQVHFVSPIRPSSPVAPSSNQRPSPPKRPRSPLSPASPRSQSPRTHSPLTLPGRGVRVPPRIITSFASPRGLGESGREGNLDARSGLSLRQRALLSPRAESRVQKMTPRFAGEIFSMYSSFNDGQMDQFGTPHPPEKSTRNRRGDRILDRTEPMGSPVSCAAKRIVPQLDKQYAHSLELRAKSDCQRNKVRVHHQHTAQHTDRFISSQCNRLFPFVCCVRGVATCPQSVGHAFVVDQVAQTRWNGVRTRFEQPITVNGDQFFPGEGPLNVKDSGLLDRMSPLQRAKMEVTRARAVGMHLYAAPRCSLRPLSPRSPPQPSPRPQLLPMLTTAVAPRRRPPSSTTDWRAKSGFRTTGPPPTP